MASIPTRAPASGAALHGRPLADALHLHARPAAPSHGAHAAAAAASMFPTPQFTPPLLARPAAAVLDDGDAMEVSPSSSSSSTFALPWHAALDAPIALPPAPLALPRAEAPPIAAVPCSGPHFGAASAPLWPEPRDFDVSPAAPAPIPLPLALAWADAPTTPPPTPKPKGVRAHQPVPLDMCAASRTGLAPAQWRALVAGDTRGAHARSAVEAAREAVLSVPVVVGGGAWDMPLSLPPPLGGPAVREGLASPAPEDDGGAWRAIAPPQLAKLVVAAPMPGAHAGESEDGWLHRSPVLANGPAWPASASRAPSPQHGSAQLARRRSSGESNSSQGGSGGMPRAA